MAAFEVTTEEITGQVGHFWKADPGQFSKAPKARGIE
jgi:hypothetical protein